MRATLDDPARLRHRLLKELWIDLKSFAATNVRDVEIPRVRGLDHIIVDGPVWRFCPLVLTALATMLECERIFEIGTFHGDTAWLLAHNLPRSRIFTLDMPSPTANTEGRLEVTDREYFADPERGTRFRGTAESERITQLRGDSATFDFAPYSGSIDLVYIDGSHSYSYVESDTQMAFGMLSELGTIVWDDYTYYPGIYAYLNELAPRLDRPIYHILGTRLAFYSRWNAVLEDP